MDFAKCVNKKCPVKEKCKIYTMPLKDRQVYADFSHGEDGCRYYLKECI
jgi:hypothetical protein